MNTLIEIIKVVTPAIITGLFTFFITKYTYNKNRPLDKMEISYNRIYYPVYNLLKRTDLTNEQVIQACKVYFVKYNKYVDRTTLMIYTSCIKKYNKDTYNSFKSNIYNKCSYLRRVLGYLEPNVFSIYTYSSANEKFAFRMLLEMLCLYISVIIISTIDYESIKTFFAALALVCLIIVLIELAVLAFQFIIRKSICFVLKIKQR